MNPSGEPESLGSSAFAKKRRAFRPLIIYLIFTLPILGWDIHRRNAARTFLRADVNLEGRSLEAPLQVEIDHQPASLDVPAPLGNHVISFSSKDTEVWETNRFVWYRENPLGTVELKRSRGELRVAVKPTPLQVSLTGRLTNVTSSGAAPTFSGLPVGDYRVRLGFQHFTRELTATVARNSSITLGDSFPAGRLQIQSEPAGGRYELEQLGGDAVQLRGEVPAAITDLPPGEYRLVVARGDYQKTRTVVLSRDQTNMTRVVFEYGKVSIATEPTNAVVTVAGKPLGKTPLLVENLMPGRYQVAAAREGFEAVRWEVEVRGDEMVTLSTNLVSVLYTAAMSRATERLSGNSKDYRAALADLTQALAAKPGDAEAGGLKQETQYLLHQQEARGALFAGQLASATKAVDAALAIRPDGKDALDLKAAVQRALAEAEALVLAARRREEERRQMEALRKVEEEERRLAMAKEAVRLKAEAEQRRLAMEKEAARLKAAEEQQRMLAEKEATKRQRLQVATDAFNKEVPNKPSVQRVTWKTSEAQSEVAAAVSRAVAQSPDKWNTVGVYQGDGFKQFTLVGIGILESARHALVQCAQLDGFTEIRVAFWLEDTKSLIGLPIKVEGKNKEYLGGVDATFRAKLERAIGKPLFTR